MLEDNEVMIYGELKGKSYDLRIVYFVLVFYI